MKNIFFSMIAILIGLSAFSQNESARVSGGMYINPARAKDKPQGSPYTQPVFAKANVPKIKVDAFMRYNVYKDEFEFITPKNDTLILDKVEDFDRVVFTGLNRKYDLVPYTVGKKLEYGYLLNLYEKNGLTLYKKERIGFVEAKVAKTSLEVSMPAKYNKLGDVFFLKNNASGTTEFPDSKKALIKMFPEKKDAIENFFKANKIDFENEKDLVQLIELIAA